MPSSIVTLVAVRPLPGSKKTPVEPGSELSIATTAAAMARFQTRSGPRRRSGWSLPGGMNAAARRVMTVHARATSQ